VKALCANYTIGPNEITPEALQLCLEPGISVSQFSRWAENERVTVTIGWRLKPDCILIETLHTVSRGLSPSRSHGVIFEGNINFALRAANHLESFTRTTEANIAAMSSSSYQILQPAFETTYETAYGNSKVGETPGNASWSQSTSPGRIRSPRYGSPVSDSGVTNHGTLTRATRRAARQHDRRHIQTSRMVQTYKRYANDVFQSTGETAEVIRALELSRMLAASQLQ